MSPHGTQHTFPLPKTTHRNGGWRLGPPTPHTPTATQRHSKSTQRGPGSAPEGSGGCSRGLGAPAKMLKEKAPESPTGEEGTPTPPLSKPQGWGGSGCSRGLGCPGAAGCSRTGPCSSRPAKRVRGVHPAAMGGPGTRHPSGRRDTDVSRGCASAASLRGPCAWNRGDEEGHPLPFYC